MQQHEIDNQGAINLVGAVYRDTCKRLIAAYRRKDAYEVRQEERWIRENNYGLVSDPDGIISRKALCEYALNQKDKNITPNDIMRFPSAQPETHDKRTKTHSCDCISRQAAIDAIAQCTCCGNEDTLRAYVLKHNLDNGWCGGILEALDAVKDLPSAQPELIRCKDCKYYREYGYVNGKPKFLPKCTFNSIYVNADDFCSRAERKTDEKENI